MPPFPDEIQDLIRGMMTVEPSQRLTIEQIKSHPAFLYGLPCGYIIPSPIPFPDLSEPFNPASIDRQMIQTLTQIGLTPDEINESIVEPSTNFVKLFIVMLSRKITLDQLPWDKAISFLPQNDIPHSLSGDGTFGEGKISLHIQKTKRHAEPSSLDFPTSYAALQPWILEESPLNFDYSEELGTTTNTLASLMFNLEKILIGIDRLIWYLHQTLKLLVKLILNLLVNYKISKIHHQFLMFLILDVILGNQH